MPYDADPDATFNPSVGGTPTAAYLDLVNADLAYLGAPWTSYTPTWTCSGSAPAIGNGTLSGAYKQIGKTLYVRISFVAGSTTTFGTGDFRFALPGSLTSVASVEQALAAKGYDSSATTNLVLAGFTPASGSYVALVSNGGTVVGSAQPITWANGDTIRITGVIEVA